MCQEENNARCSYKEAARDSACDSVWSRASFEGFGQASFSHRLAHGRVTGFLFVHVISILLDQVCLF